MNNKLLGHKVMFPSLKGSYQNIKFFIISGIIKIGTKKFSTKICNRDDHPEVTQHHLLPLHHTLAKKCLKKSGRAIMGALVSKNFIFWNAFSCFSPQ